MAARKDEPRTDWLTAQGPILGALLGAREDAAELPVKPKARSTPKEKSGRLEVNGYSVSRLTLKHSQNARDRR